MKRRDFLKMSATVLAGATAGRAFGSASACPARPKQAGAESLRSLAARRGLLIGSACGWYYVQGNPACREILAREFNCTVAENDLKMEAIQPVRGQFDFSRTDALMTFAAQHDMQVRAVPLVWFDGLPDWAKDKTFCRNEAIDILREHIFAVMKRYRGQIFAWDVVNEALSDENKVLREDCTWFRSIGTDYLDVSYHLAHEADPKTELFINDYWIEGKTERSDRCYHLLKELLGRGVPIHGLGLQYHVQARTAPSSADVSENLKRFMDLGLKIHITELDVWVPKNATEADFRQQADVYRGVFKMALALKLPAVVMWGFTDRYSWVPATSNGEFDHALIFDQDCRPKPAYEAIRSVLREG